MVRSIAAVVLLGSLTGCALRGPEDARPPVDLIAAAQIREWVVLNEQKAALAGSAHDSRVFDVPGHGAVHVREWRLEGGPGWEYVRARFTYQNTTGKALDEARVVLIVENHDGSRASAAQIRLRHPLGRKLVPGMMFADEVRAETGGLHRDSRGWKWTIAIEAVESPAWGVATPGDLALR
jgi:predicted small lipoprotein YifL